MANIKVAVRVRPISEREFTLTGSEVVVHTDQKKVSLTNLKVSSSKAGDSRERTRRYGFDYCFNSSDPESEENATQEKIYESLGNSVLDAIFSGYNACLIAYGQSASGKTYTMMGPKDDPGLTPRLCEGLFLRIFEEQKNDRTYQTSVSVISDRHEPGITCHGVGLSGSLRGAVVSSYLEVYNERVRDLLRPSSGSGGLRVREHPRLGPYVQGLTRHVVRTLGSLMSYVVEGTKARKTASTLQNPTSSRSHALLTVSLSQNLQNGHPGTTEIKHFPRGSKLHLVDLAGSESAATCSGIHRLKEGANINKSLVALGNVISALAERGATGSGPGRRFIPYRDSALTWLLKDALGGNATTIMLATISPASGSYNETAHTLRFAQRAQSVVNRPVINEDPVARIIRELREEVSRLKSLLLEKSIEVDGKSICCCKHNEELEGKQDRRSTTEHQVAAIVEEGEKEEELNSAWNTSRNCSTIASVPVRRYNSNESLISGDTDTSTSIRRFGSFEFPVSESFFKERRYDRAEISELKYNEAEESVFVDIPTLVAVLIKPDDTLQERSTQIEEICSDGVLDNPIDTELLENSANGVQVSCSDVRSSNNDLAKLGDNDESSVRPVDLVPFNSNKPEADFRDNSSQPRITVVPDISSNRRNVGKLRKLGSIDSTELEKSSNLQVSKKFGSVDALSKKRESLNSIQRSQTNLEKRFGNSDKAKKLNNIKEIEDQRSGGSGGLWQASGSCGNKDLQRKGSNDSGSSSQRLRNLPRKQSIDGLKRKTSKDSSSSSSKEDQILISNLARDKLRRKSLLDQEIENRSHTPIQRVNRRAEIVAAVTQRLYSSKRNSEEATTNTPGSEFHSSENSDVRLTSTTRMRLQEISRKMLAKRRKICVDTQTDNPQTIRVKDTASLTDSLKVTCEDIGTLTDHHEDCESLSGTASPVLRVKEMATLTEGRRRSTVRCKDVAILTDDREEDYEIHSPRNDSGILSDDTQNYAESNLSSTEISDLCGESDSRLEGRNVEFVENSTNTSSMFADCVSSSTAQTDQRKNVGTRGFPVGCDSRVRECCHGSVNNERNVISISLPDMIGITIESSNILESKIVIVDSTDVPEDKIKADLKDTGAQTDPKSMSECSTNTEECYSYVYFSDRSTSMKPSDDRIFRIENIFRDPKNCNRSCCMIDTPPDLMENALARNSFTFTNSVGTSFVPETKERSTEIERESLHGLESDNEIPRRGSLTIDRSTENALDVNEHSCKSSPRRWVSLSSIDCPTSETLLVLNSTEGIQLSTCKPEFEIQSIISKQVPNGSERLTDGDLVLLQEDRSLVRSSDPVKQYFEKIRNNGERSVDDRMDSKNSLESDANFSDDSLDLNESITRYDVTEVKTELRVGEIFKGSENYCPPDVVAHTNMDGSRSSSRSVEDVGSLGADQDFEDSYVVEFPKTNPNSIAFQMHDYKSLILGDPCFGPVNDQAQLDEDSSEDEVKRSVGKKRVSFSSSEVFSEGTQSPVCRYNNLPPKSIIKKKYSVSVNPEGPALQKEHEDPVLKDTKDWSPCSVTENKSDVVFKPRSTSSKPDDPENFIVDSSGCRNSHEEHDSPLPNHRESASKKVRFSTSEGTTSDSDSYENYDNCDNCDKEPRDILVEYLDEAAAFMRNMNSMNEYMSATKLFERFFEDKSDRCCESDEHDLDDHVEYEGRRISLKDLDMSCDKCLKEDDFVVPVDSYENCLKGIERLESCIRKVKRHNEVLREKYGINVESADTKYRLVESSIDSARLRLGLDYDSTLKEIEISNAISSSEELENIGRWKWKNDLTKDDEDHDEVVKNNVNLNHRDHLDDLEERHFSNLMNESNLDRSKNLAKPRVRRSTRMSDLRSKSPSSYSRLRGKYRIQGSSPSCNYTENVQSSFESAKENRFEDSARRNSSGFPIRDQEDPRSTENGVGATKVLENLKTPDCFLFLPTTSDGDDFSRTNRSSSSPRRAFYSKNEFSSDSTSSTDTIAASTESMDTLSNFRDGPRYPGSPRAKFLQLLSERRRIVQNSRSSSAY